MDIVVRSSRPFKGFELVFEGNIALTDRITAMSVLGASNREALSGNKAKETAHRESHQKERKSWETLPMGGMF